MESNYQRGGGKGSMFDLCEKIQITNDRAEGGEKKIYPMIQQPATNKYQCGHLQSSTKCHKIVWVGPPSFSIYVSFAKLVVLEQQSALNIIIKLYPFYLYLPKLV